MQMEDFKAKRLKREDEEWNDFVDNLVNKHMGEFTDADANYATNFNKWIVDHLISLHSTRLGQAEKFLTEKMKSRSAKEFEEFLKNFGEKGKSIQKFEAILETARTPAPIVVPKDFVELAEKIAPKINAAGKKADLAFVLQAAHDAFGKENLLLFTKKTLVHVLAKNPGWKGEELARHINYLKEHVKVSEGAKEEEFERVVGPLLHRMLRQGTPAKGDKTFDNVVTALKMFAPNKSFEREYFYAMAERA
ncbi:hypothetical protein H0N96_00375 [Candidatus Micrarchaeota archaeon]|nr:hypothetical protein [Candidatus Micrarchaeota archaeon]